MKDLRILWLGKNDINKVSCYSLHFRRELEKHAEVSTYGINWPHPDLPGGHPGRWKEMDARKLVKVFNPDLIYISLYTWDHLDKIDIPKTMFWTDPHGDTPGNIAWAKRSRIDSILMPYIGRSDKYGIPRYEKMFADSPVKIRFFPFWVDTEVFKDYGFERDIDLCLLGRTGWRPFRLKIFNYYKDEGGKAGENYKVFYYPRPKRNWDWPDERLKKHGFVARESYAKLLARCKGYPMPCGVARYTVPKYFEGPAAKTLVFSNVPAGAEQCHFVPDETFVHIEPDNFTEKIDYYLENDGERKKIVDAAYKNVHKYHSVKIRVQEFLDHVENELF